MGEHGGWHKSSYSGANNDCVEARETSDAVDLRDTQNREHGHITFPASEWSAFLRDVRNESL